MFTKQNMNQSAETLAPFNVGHYMTVGANGRRERIVDQYRLEANIPCFENKLPTNVKCT